MSGGSLVEEEITVPVPKSVKIDLDAEYPCPCCRAGYLKPIMLTEAFGCDQCQKIFVVQDNNHELEQLSGAYPYKRSWCWNGRRWISTHSPLREVYLPVLGVMLLLLVVAGLTLSFQFSWLLLVMLFAIFSFLMVGLAYRRN